MRSRYPHGVLNQRNGFGNLSGQLSQVLRDTCPWVSVPSVGWFQSHLKWTSKSPDSKVPFDGLGPTLKKKIKKVSAVPQCMWLLANRCFQISCHRCFTFLVVSEANESREKQLLLLEGKETLRDMSQIHGKESLTISAVHRLARVFGCFFLLWKFWIVMFVCLLVFWLILFNFKSC